MNSKFLTCTFALTFGLLIGCSKQPEAAAGGGSGGGAEEDVYIDKDLLEGLKTEAAGIVLDKPTPEKEALGKLLFADKRLSKGGDVSCASCHNLENSGVDGQAHGTGTGGAKTKRNVPTVLNVGKQMLFTWDGRITNLEELGQKHVVDPTTHGLADEAELVAKLNAIPEAVEGFKKAYGGDAAVSAANFGKAIAAYLRTLTTRSRWDDYAEGNDKALTSEEKKGLKLFLENACQTCHAMRSLGGLMLMKFGNVKLYASADLGKFEATKVETDKGFFKVPGLANVEKTAPYLHDGSAKTLEETIKLMTVHQFGKDLTDAKAASIAAFLKALTAKK